jgi:hypothetical protein
VRAAARRRGRRGIGHPSMDINRSPDNARPQVMTPVFLPALQKGTLGLDQVESCSWEVNHRDLSLAMQIEAIKT